MTRQVSEETIIFQAILRFVLHQVAGTPGVGAFCAVLLQEPIRALHLLIPAVPRADWFLTAVPGFPVQFAGGIALAFWFSKKHPSKAALFVWIAPLLIAVLQSVAAVNSGHSPLRVMGVNCNPAQRCFD